jgi:hypothetical protein
MAFILILVLVLPPSGASVSMIEFGSEAACRAAGAEATKLSSGMRWVCVRRFVPSEPK